MLKLIIDITFLVGLRCIRVACFIVLINSPQSIILLLILQAFLVSVILRLIRNIWFCYILFLVFLGGILVIFIYIRSLASSIYKKSWEGREKKILKFIFLIVLGLVYFRNNSLPLNIFIPFFMDRRLVYLLVSN